MAQNRRPEAEAQEGSSSEEEEGSSEEIEEHEDSESESEEEEKDKAPAPPSTKKPFPFPLKKPEPTQASTHRKILSSDESGSESASESDSPNPNVKPLASKPMEEPPKATKKPRSKLSSVTPVAKSTKRPVESENNNRESKRAKKRLEDADRAVAGDTGKKTGDDSKKQLFQRLWSQDDEIAILKGMIEYKEKKGADPVTEMNAFHDFIKRSLHVDVSKVQLSDKMRRLRKKYENNFRKANKGKDRTFSKAHEQLAYEWSKKIWGGGDANGGVVESTKLDGEANKSRTQKPTTKDDGPASPYRAKEGTKKAVEANSVTPRLLQSRSSIAKLGFDDDIVKDGLELISGSERVELEEKWRKFRIQEIELYLWRLDLIHEQTKLVLEALKSSGN